MTRLRSPCRRDAIGSLGGGEDGGGGVGGGGSGARGGAPVHDSGNLLPRLVQHIVEGVEAAARRREAALLSITEEAARADGAALADELVELVRHAVQTVGGGVALAEERARASDRLAGRHCEREGRRLLVSLRRTRPYLRPAIHEGVGLVVRGLRRDAEEVEEVVGGLILREDMGGARRAVLLTDERVTLAVQMTTVPAYPPARSARAISVPVVTFPVGTTRERRFWSRRTTSGCGDASSTIVANSSIAESASPESRPSSGNTRDAG